MNFFQTPEWEESKNRFEAWWSGEIIDRPLVQVIVPNAEVINGEHPRAVSLESKWLDADYRINAFEWELARTRYFGDAFPYMDTLIGPGTFSLYIGANPGYQENTVWYHKCYDDITSAAPPSFDSGNKYWQASLELARKASAQLRGRALVSFPDLIENLDTLAALFGAEELLEALMDYPEKVHEFQKAVLPLYIQHYELLRDEITDENGGTCFTAFRIYGKGRVAKLQCDISAMLSRNMFNEFVVPYLTEQCRHIEKTVYHWDGVSALQHEEALLSIKELNAIQWTPGAGQPSMGDKEWWPLYHRVKAAGKQLLLQGLYPDEMEPLIQELGPEGLNIVIWTESEDIARNLIKSASAYC